MTLQVCLNRQSLFSPRDKAAEWPRISAKLRLSAGSLHLLVERWLKAPMQSTERQLQKRDKGTPQGGVVSPILTNLFLHYAFDLWVTPLDQA